MDTEHRHELKDGDLERFLREFPQWWAQYGNKLLLAILVVLVVIFGWRMWKSKAAAADERIWQSLATARDPYALREIALISDDPNIRARAHLRAADMLLLASVRPAGAEPDPLTGRTASTDPEADRDMAREDYQAVLKQDGAHVVLKLNAKMGLAAIAETVRDFDRAEQLYAEVQAEAGGTFDSIAGRASVRQSLLPQLARPVVFGPEPERPASLPDGSGLMGLPSGSELLPVAPDLGAGFDLPFQFDPSMAEPEDDPDTEPIEPAPSETPVDDAPADEPAGP